ncbi:hypothetical protein LshimejAT787_0903430 [Lyophyllum shimeji]|uniref:Secreted protein n=1 Tax=Lyophyllum shimeji TaxID=47721 RepID=A0A9P3PSA3_LYOSH|nr:hypothetical protein LshimejAT787_0903430 [Lyophyllum shimeji]
MLFLSCALAFASPAVSSSWYLVRKVPSPFVSASHPFPIPHCLLAAPFKNCTNRSVFIAMLSRSGIRSDTFGSGTRYRLF